MSRLLLSCILWAFLVLSAPAAEKICPKINLTINAPKGPVCAGSKVSISASDNEIPGDYNGMTTYPTKQWTWEVSGIESDPQTGVEPVATFTPSGGGDGTILFNLTCTSSPGCEDCDAAFTAQANFHVVEANLGVDCNHDGTYDENDEALEESDGGLLGVNHDDDNANGMLDMEEPGLVDGENDLIPIYLNPDQAMVSGSVTLEAVSGGEKIRIWKTAAREGLVTLPMTWHPGNGTVPAIRYVEGIQASDSLGDVKLRLSYKSEGGEHSDTIVLTVFGVDIDVDSDNSGEISKEDNQLEEISEFLFWLNNNNNYGYAVGRDCDDNVIGGEMDLQDLAPFRITMFNNAFPDGSKAYLEMGDGSAVVRVLRHGGCEKEHLHNKAVAALMANRTSYRSGIVGGGERVELDFRPFANASPVWFVLEGVKAGAGDLYVVLRDAKGIELCRDQIHLKFYDVDELWSELNLRKCTGKDPSPPGPIFADWLSGIADDDVTWDIVDGKWGRANRSALISIHGYNNNEYGGRDYHRDVFKRLYWCGYRSNFIGILWTGDERMNIEFNINVFNSFQAGSALGTILTNLSFAAGSRRLQMMTHSLGNNVASEAIRTNKAGIVDSYVMCEAATGAGAYMEGATSPSNENSKLLAQARTYGYKERYDLSGSDFDDVWRNRWADNPVIHPGGDCEWWPTTPIEKPNYVNYSERWKNCYVEPDPQRGYFKSVPCLLGGMLYCSYSAEDAVVGDTKWGINVWLDNQIGVFLVPPHRPDDAADDNDWDFLDIYDEDLPEQASMKEGAAVITEEVRKWALLSYYFCDLTSAAGASGIGDGDKYRSVNAAEQGIDSHGAMRSNPLYKVWKFWSWAGTILGQ